MFLNIFLETWFFSDLKNFMGFMMIKKLFEKHLTPGRYPVQKICPPKNGISVQNYKRNTTPLPVSYRLWAIAILIYLFSFLFYFFDKK